MMSDFHKYIKKRCAKFTMKYFNKYAADGIFYKNGEYFLKSLTKCGSDVIILLYKKISMTLHN